MESGEFIRPPGNCEPLQSIIHRYGGSFAPGKSAQAVHYKCPAWPDREMECFFSQGEPGFQPEPRFLGRLPEGRVFGSGIVISPDGQSIARDVSPDFGKSFKYHWLLTYPEIKEPERLSGTTAVIATTLGFGYSHWLLEELPRLLSLGQNSFDHLIAHGKSEAASKAFQMAGVSGKRVEASRLSHRSCEILLVPSMQSAPGFPDGSLVEGLREFTAPLHADFSYPCEKIYCSRAKSRRRKVSNETALWEKLEEKGFVKVDLEDLDWSSQINLFRQAKVIVSPHGAALANLAFSLPGTRVVEFFNRSYLNGCYWRLASAAGLDYRPVLSSGNSPLSNTSTHNRLDIEADIEPILDALAD